jgi:hypothetical protein
VFLVLFALTMIGIVILTRWRAAKKERAALQLPSEPSPVGDAAPR